MNNLFDRMVTEALRWQGAHVNAECRLLRHKNNKGALAVARTSGKSYLDEYLEGKFGVSRCTAHEVTNWITHYNLWPDRRAQVSEFASEPWAKEADALTWEHCDSCELWSANGGVRPTCSRKMKYMAGESEACQDYQSRPEVDQ